jgi:phosphohistidine phosphatase SixA
MSSSSLRALLPVLLAVLVASIAVRLPTAAARQDGDASSERLPPGLLYPRTIFVVRHGEKADETAKDPALSDAGRLRATALSGLLRHSGITHAFSTEFQRTQQTLAPLCDAVGVQLRIVPSRDPGALLSALDNMPRNSVAVVAGHSNTVPSIVAELAPDAWLVAKNPDALKLGDQDYDRLFVVTQWAPGKQGATVVEMRY